MPGDCVRMHFLVLIIVIILIRQMSSVEAEIRWHGRRSFGLQQNESGILVWKKREIHQGADHQCSPITYNLASPCHDLLM